MASHDFIPDHPGDKDHQHSASDRTEPVELISARTFRTEPEDDPDAHRNPDNLDQTCKAAETSDSDEEVGSTDGRILDRSNRYQAGQCGNKGRQSIRQD